MWIRSAFWVGRPKDGAADQLKVAIDGELIPAMRAFPGVAEVHALWPRKREDNPPDIFCQVIVRFETAEDMAAMLGSAERVALRPRVLAAAALFDGKLSHIDYEVA